MRREMSPDPCFFFFSSRRRHTRFKCDWSSDVCSSDLPVARHGPAGHWWAAVEAERWPRDPESVERILDKWEIGRASCRERVYISVVAVSLKKKKNDSRRA